VLEEPGSENEMLFAWRTESGMLMEESAAQPQNACFRIFASPSEWTMGGEREAAADRPFAYGGQQESFGDDDGR
jgi:hypothetical protein